MACRGFLSRIPRAYQQQRGYSAESNRPMAVAAAYEELGLKVDASIDEVKAAYRRLALKCHPDLHTKDSAEFVRITAAYQQIMNRSVVYVPGAQARHRRPDIRAHPGPVRFDQKAVTAWGLGLATGCILFGAVLLWGRTEMARSTYQMKGPTRVIEPSPNAVKRERIAALLLEKSKTRDEGTEEGIE